jgi:kinesin family protein 1
MLFFFPPLSVCICLYVVPPRYADRAKQIKNKAIINVDPTELLIGKLKEENARLMKQLEAFTKGGNPDWSLLEGGAPTGPISAEEKERLKKELQAQLAAELEANKLLLGEESKSWQRKYEEAQASFSAADAKEALNRKRRETEPHLVNINEDPSLSGMVVQYLSDKAVVGRKDGNPPPLIPLAGLSISKVHATFLVQGSNVTIEPSEGAKTMVNGEVLASSRKLFHMDRVLFGASHMYYVVIPSVAAEGKEGEITAPTWEEAQEEIAKVQGFGVEKKDLSNLSQVRKLD